MNCAKRSIISKATNLYHHRHSIQQLSHNTRSYASFLQSAMQYAFKHAINIDEIVHSSDMEVDHNIQQVLDSMLHKNFETNYNQGTDSFYDNQQQLWKLFDPKKVVDIDIEAVLQQIPETVKSKDPIVNSAATYFFKKSGKMFRPTVILLMGRACLQTEQQQNPELSVQKLRKLAEVTEMIHVASLIHDDIVDESDTRRGLTTLHKLHGNRVAVQSGDYLLARSCFELATLENHDVSKLIATAIELLAFGEISQAAHRGSESSFPQYMKSIYCKTASIIANSCKAAATLSNSSKEVTQHAYTYGKHLGIAYQLIDDILDFTQTSDELGKPSQGADLNTGIATGPVLFAAKEFPEIQPMINRQFSRPGDKETVLDRVYRSNGIDMTKKLALTHCKKAIHAAMQLEPSSYRNSLILLVDKARSRNK